MKNVKVFVSYVYNVNIDLLMSEVGLPPRVDRKLNLLNMFER